MPASPAEHKKTGREGKDGVLRIENLNELKEPYMLKKTQGSTLYYTAY